MEVASLHWFNFSQQLRGDNRVIHDHAAERAERVQEEVCLGQHCHVGDNPSDLSVVAADGCKALAPILATAKVHDFQRPLIGLEECWSVLRGLGHKRRWADNRTSSDHTVQPDLHDVNNATTKWAWCADEELELVMCMGRRRNAQG